MKKTICAFVSVLLAFETISVVNADSNTYIIFETGCYTSYGRNDNNYKLNKSFNSDVRSVALKTGNNVRVYYVKDSDFRYGEKASFDGITSCASTTSSPDAKWNNNIRYYYDVDNAGDVGAEYYFTMPVITVSNNANVDEAINYTYGSGAVDPAPPAPDFGELANVGYNTKIAGSGQASINNLDTVSWNPETDTSGNDISDMSVSIRVVPGKYTAASRQSLAEKLYSDFVLNTLDATVLDTVPVSSGSFSVTWSDVIDELAIPFATISSLIDQDGTFIKNGWIYQVRLEGDNYEGEWQTVYTATSSGVQNDLTIIQSTTINQTLVNTITEINQLNNTENNWYINETTINMSDYSEPSQGEKPWWAYLLEAIVSLINKVVDGIASIVGAIADLVGDIIDGILGLFTFDSFSVPDFSTHQQNIHDNSGIFGESIDILQTMNETLSNADSSAEPILYYPGIDLEGVEFIPEITINLNDYVEDLELTQWHNLAYTCTDILIWSSLIYTIYRKLIGVFKK